MKIGVIGTGTMGAGIAEQAISRGLKVILVKATPGALDPIITKIRANLQKRLGRETGLPLMEVMMERLTVTNQLEDLVGCEIVIEAVAENLEIKDTLMMKLSEILPAQTVIGTNTSTLYVQEIAEGYIDPTMVIGIHFMNPVPGKLVTGAEIISTTVTSQQAILSAISLMDRMGKVYSIAPDTAGFIVNRVLFSGIASAILMFEESSDQIQIDSAMRNSANHPMGPLELADLVGLDITLSILEILKTQLGYKALPVPELLKRMVGLGFLGKKSGKGFYTYENGKIVPTSLP